MWFFSCLTRIFGRSLQQIFHVAETKGLLLTETENYELSFSTSMQHPATHGHKLNWFISMLFSGIKKYIVSLIIKTSSDPEALDKKKVFLGKLNMILVQVLLYYALCCLFSARLVDVTTDMWLGIARVCPTIASHFGWYFLNGCRSNKQAAVPVVSIYNETIILRVLWVFNVFLEKKDFTITEQA